MLACFLSMIMLGVVRLGIIGYTQAQADGVTYVTAHALARNSSIGTRTARSLASSIFTGVSSSNVTDGRTTTQAYADYEPTLTNLGLLPGASNIFHVRSHYVEQQYSSQVSAGSVNVYVPLTTLCSFITGTVPQISGSTGSYQLYVAQYTDSSTADNGRYGEWYCHYTTYSSLLSDLPSTYPAGITPGQTHYNNSHLYSCDSDGYCTASSGFTMSPSLVDDEQTIYGWDGTTPGSSASCSTSAAWMPQ